MRFVHTGIKKMAGMESLAHHPALHIDLGHDDGVDLAFFHEGGEIFER